MKQLYVSSCLQAIGSRGYCSDIEVYSANRTSKANISFLYHSKVPLTKSTFDHRYPRALRYNGLSTTPKNLKPAASNMVYLTVLSSLNANFGKQFEEFLSHQNIDVRESKLLSLGGKFPAATQYLINISASAHDPFLTSLKVHCETKSLDFVLRSSESFNTHPALVCFDMDSTLIKTEVIDELANRAGVGDQVSAITARAMRGELDFRASYTARMKLIQGLREDVLIQVADNLPMMEGAEALIRNLRKIGIKTAILSGGFEYFAKHLKVKLGIDYIYANKLEIEDGALTGRAVEPIVDAERKALLLKELSAELGLDSSQTVAVGDGANDLKMIAQAGLGIAYHAKPLVRESAPHAVNFADLSSLLFILGYKESELV